MSRFKHFQILPVLAIAVAGAFSHGVLMPGGTAQDRDFSDSAPDGSRQQETSAVAQQEILFGLKPGPGRELVLGYCMPCHSTTLVAANHMTRENWDKTIGKMQSVNGMQPIPDDIRRQILDYLETAQRVEDRNLQASKQSPWASPLYSPNPLW